MKQRLIVGLGEVLWDMFPTGSRFGGAPANFACSVAGLTTEDTRVVMASAIGEDDLGKQARSTLAERGVDTSALQTVSTPTGKVLVDLDAQGVASYRFAESSAWDHLKMTREWKTLASTCDAVCFGSLGQRKRTARATICDFVATAKPSALKIFDVNLRPPFVASDVLTDSLALANVVKLNEQELPVLADQLGLTGSETDQLIQLQEACQLSCVALTKGPEGAVVVSGGKSYIANGKSVDVADTVGAGDAFTAALAVGLLAENTLEQIADHAIKVASFVCTQVGATPDLRSSSFDETR